MTKSKLQRIQELEQQLAQLKAEAVSDIKQWEPVGGGWAIFSDGKVVDIESESYSKNFGTERPTEEQALKAINEMRVFNRLLAYRDEFDPDFVPNWDNGCWDKFYIFYSHGTWSIASQQDIFIFYAVSISQKK